MPLSNATRGRVASRLCLCCAVLLATAASACTGPVERTGQTSIDESFAVGGFGWKSGGIVYLFAGLREHQGKVEVCAASMPEGLSGSASKFTDDVMGSVIVMADGERVMQGLGFASTLPVMDDVAGQPAACARGNSDWKPAYAEAEVTLRTPPMRFID